LTLICFARRSSDDASSTSRGTAVLDDDNERRAALLFAVLCAHGAPQHLSVVFRRTPSTFVATFVAFLTRAVAFGRLGAIHLDRGFISAVFHQLAVRCAAVCNSTQLTYLLFNSDWRHHRND
jgi:hypothetical protein